MYSLLYSVITNDCRDDQMLLVWPPRSPDVTPCDFFLRGYGKDQVYVPALLGKLQTHLHSSHHDDDSIITTQTRAVLYTAYFIYEFEPFQVFKTIFY
jgi:hypothetical protein